MRKILIELQVDWEGYEDVSDELIVEDAIEAKVEGVGWTLLRQPPVIGRSELLLDFLAWFGRTYSPEELKVVGMQQLINEYEKRKQ